MISLDKEKIIDKISCLLRRLPPYSSYSKLTLYFPKIYLFSKKGYEQMRIIEEEITYVDSQYPNELKVIVDKAQDLMNEISNLRWKYQSKNQLPLEFMDSDYENLIEVLDCIETEILKFGEPAFIQKEFVFLSKEDIKKMIEDDTLGDTGLDEWIEEALIKI